jgi:catechol 2,3-dioxygenase-like lactoylglutathione lyase family enzyme
VVKIDGLDHVALTVTDVSRSVAWYRDTLDFERYHEEAWGNEPAVVGAGGTGLALFAASVASPAAPPGKDTLTLRHVAFRTDRASWEELRERFRRDSVPYQFEDHGISHSLYLHDPDGHRLEVTTYDV